MNVPHKLSGERVWICILWQLYGGERESMGQIIVGMADMKVGTGDDELVTYALGSCVGICIYDEGRQIGGMLHAMLPQATDEGIIFPFNRYVDSGIPQLYKALCRRGADTNRLKAKVIGGAKMFDFAMQNGNADIGTSNIRETKFQLMKLGIPIVSEMVGGDVGRTVYFSVDTGIVKVRTTTNQEFTI